MTPLRSRECISKMFTSLLICLLLLYGRYVCDYVDLLKSPLLTTDILSVVVCCCWIFTSAWSSDYKLKPKSSVSTIVASIILILCSTIFFHVMLILFGAPFISSAKETFHFACLLTCTTVVPYCLVLGMDMDSWLRVLCQNDLDSRTEITLRTSTLCSVMGAWLGAFPIPLDWDRPWQVWPISCVIGTALGHVCGLLLSQVQLMLRDRTLQKSKLG